MSILESHELHVVHVEFVEFVVLIKEGEGTSYHPNIELIYVKLASVWATHAMREEEEEDLEEQGT